MQVAKAARLGLKIVSVLAGLALALMLAWLGINLVDEDLSAAAQAMLALPSNPYPPEDNLYIAMAGFDAPSGRSIVEAGKARIDSYNQALDSMLVDPDAAVAFVERSAPEALKFNGDMKAWSLLTSSIWTSAKSRRADVAALLSSNAELFQRYLTLHQLHGYFETARPSHLAPAVYVSQHVRAMFLADVANRIQIGSPPERRAAFRELLKDLQMWKAVLDGDGTLLSKMIGVASLHADILLIGDMIADSSADLSFVDGDQSALVTPFGVGAWKIGKVFDAEMRVTAPVLATIPLANSPVAGSSAHPASWWERQWNVLQVQFFKLHATENLDAEKMARLRALADGDPAQFSKAREDYHRWLDQKGSIVSLNTLYNPIGKVLLGIASPAYEDYPMRVYDVAAFQRLVFLAYQIRRLGISAAGVPSFMKLHPEWATHPIDAQPFRWDPAARKLEVVTVGTRPEDRRFSLTLDASAIGR